MPRWRGEHFFGAASESSIQPGLSIRQNCVIPAEAGIQRIKNLPRKRDTHGFVRFAVVFFHTGFRPPPE
jgi:hypothetical protein